MQIRKENIKNVLLDTAKSEFLKNGFRGTSMRRIAAESEVGLSNIYNYFDNKDEIFKEILSSLLNDLDIVMIKHNNPDDIAIYVDDTEQYTRMQIELFVGLIDNHKENFKLLLFKSTGSSLENFREECIEKYTEQGRSYINIVKQKYPLINNKISDFFIHTMSSWWMSSIAELVMHDLSRNEMENFIKEYITYSTAGWKNLMKIDTH